MTATYFEIPLTPNAQTFFVTVSNIIYQMKLVYRNNVEGGWVLDIADVSGNPLVQGIPLITGLDLLAAYPDKSFGFSLHVATDGNPTEVPTFNNLGQQSHLYVGVTI